MKFSRRRDLIEAEAVTKLRETLGLSQSQLANALGVSRRTIIRGEQRGIEIPFFSGQRGHVREAWMRLQKQAQVTLSTGSRAKCHRTGGDS